MPRLRNVILFAILLILSLFLAFWLVEASYVNLSTLIAAISLIVAIYGISQSMWQTRTQGVRDVFNREKLTCYIEVKKISFKLIAAGGDFGEKIKSANYIFEPNAKNAALKDYLPQLDDLIDLYKSRVESFGSSAVKDKVYAFIEASGTEGLNVLIRERKDIGDVLAREYYELSKLIEKEINEISKQNSL